MTLRPAFARSTLSLLIAAACIAPSATLAQTDTDEKIRRLEESIETMKRELEEVKSQTQDAKDKATQVEQRADSQGVQNRFNEGVSFEDPRGDWSVRVSGRAQLDYRDYLNNVLANVFSMRRIRLGAGVTLYKDYTVYVEGDFASGDATGTTQQQSRATLAYIDVNWWKPARIRLGQFKPQIGLEQTLLDLQSDYMERGLQQNILDGNGINYDRGFMVFGAPLPGTWYAVTVSNGTGQNLEEKQANVQESDGDKKDVTVRGVLDFAKILSVHEAIFHIGANYKWGEQTNSTANPFAAPVARTAARGITFFNPAAFNAAATATTAARNVSNIDRKIKAAELLMAYGPVKLQSEYWTAEYSGTRYAPGPGLEFSPEIKAGYVSAMWQITGESYSDFYRDSIPQKIKPRNRFSWGSDSGWGAWEVGLRYSFFDGSDFKTTNPVSTGQLGAGAATVTPAVTTSTNKATAYTAQLKWIQNTYVRTLLDYVHTKFDTPVVVNTKSVDHEDAIMMRFQVDF